MKIKYLLTLSICITATSNCNDADPSHRDFLALTSAVNRVIDYKNARSIKDANTKNIGGLAFGDQVFSIIADFGVEIRGNQGRSERKLIIEFQPTSKMIGGGPAIKQLVDGDDKLGIFMFKAMTDYLDSLRKKTIPSNATFQIAISESSDGALNYNARVFKKMPIIPDSHRLEAPPAPTPAKQAGSSNAPRAQQPNTGEFKCRYCAQAFRNAIAKGLHQENCPSKK